MTPPIHEREAEARVQALEVFDELFPHIVGNPYIPHWPHPRQAMLLRAHLDYPGDGTLEVLFGGAVGGGKSDALLMGAAQFVHVPTFAGVCIRKTYAALSKPGNLLSRAHKWWGSLPKDIRPHWNNTDKVYTFPSGAQVQFGYHDHPSHDDQYQGAEYQYVAWDELTQWETDAAYDWVSLSRMRQCKGPHYVPMRSIAASNPGGPGHVWVRDKWPRTIGRDEGPPYIPSKLKDNPSLDPEYRRNLLRMHPTRRQQLLDGDWRARDPGDYFRVEWFGVLIDPEYIAQQERIRIRWWDLAASESDDAARTAGVLMSRLRSGVRVVEHARAFRATPGKRDGEIVRQAHLDGRGTIVGLELEPGSGGAAQVEALAKRLKSEGFRVVWARPKAELSGAEARLLARQPVAEKGKAGRCDPVASCLERGYQMRAECSDSGEPWWGTLAGKPLIEQTDGLRLVVGAWTQEYLDEIEGFPEAALLDFADATSGAWAWLEAHPYGLQAAPSERTKPRPPAEQQNVHPEDRENPAAAPGPAIGATRTGRGFRQL